MLYAGYSLAFYVISVQAMSYELQRFSGQNLTFKIMDLCNGSMNKSFLSDKSDKVLYKGNNKKEKAENKYTWPKI